MRSIKKCCELIQLNASDCDVPLDNPIYALCTEIMNIEKAYKEEHPESADYRRGLSEGINKHTEITTVDAQYLIDYLENWKDESNEAIILTIQNDILKVFVNHEALEQFPESVSE